MCMNPQSIGNFKAFQILKYPTRIPLCSIRLSNLLFSQGKGAHPMTDSLKTSMLTRRQ